MPIDTIKPEALSVRPSPARMLTWLIGPNVVAPGGSVISWFNPEHPGHPYPEAAAWLLDFLARAVPSAGVVQNRFLIALRARIAQWLLCDVAAGGGAGRDGTRYVFDTAIVMDALLAKQQAGGLAPDAASLARLFDFVCTALGRRRGSDSAATTTPPHWSNSYGCHLLRLLPVLIHYAWYSRQNLDAHGCTAIERAAYGLAAQLLEDLSPLLERGRFVTHGGSRVCYTHSHCYAVEGLLGFCRMDPGVPMPFSRQRVSAFVRDCAHWLGSVQQPDGGIPAFHDGVSPSCETRADATAQSVRIWLAVDRGRFAAQIAAGLGFLARLQHPCGGLAYSPTCADVNTWATVFAADAVLAAGVQPAGMRGILSQDANWISLQPLA